MLWKGPNELFWPVKESACNVGDLGSIPGFGRSPGEGKGNPLQYSCLENSMDRAWWAAVHMVAELDMTEWLSLSLSIYIYTHTPQLSWPWEPIQTQKLDWWRFKHQTYRTGYMERFPWWLSDKESACQCKKCRFNPWVEKIPWRRKWQATPVFLSGKSYGQRSVEGYSPWGHKESDTTERLSTYLGGQSLPITKECAEIHTPIPPGEMRPHGNVDQMLSSTNQVIQCM